MGIEQRILTEAPHWCQFTIFKGESITEAVPQMVDPVSGSPFNLSLLPSLRFDLYVRPTYDYSTKVLWLASQVTSGAFLGIKIDDAPQGLISIYLGYTNVATLPEGEWEQFLNMTYTDATAGEAVTETLWRGPCLILPGRTT